MNNAYKIECNTLHLKLKLNDLIGFQSWIHDENEFYIEYYYLNNTKITTAYGKKIYGLMF